MRALQKPVLCVALPLILASCMADKSPQTGTGMNGATNHGANLTTGRIIGTITNVEGGVDGAEVILSTKGSGEKVVAIVSIPNLGPASEFNFDHLRNGAMLKLEGDLSQIDGVPRIAARRARSLVDVHMENGRASAKARGQCEALGGIVRPAGMAGWDMCVQQLPDAGEPCADESECFGRCVLPPETTPQQAETATQGICEATNDIFGCAPLVSAGEYAGTLCVD